MTAEAAVAGLLVLDKPSGITSHDVVARVRRVLGIRKVGHAGTLDPMATGVLLVGVGRATRLLGHLSLTEKAYRATIRLGVCTGTDDAEGEVLAARDASGAEPEAVRRALAAMVGEIDQVPSAVSAIKVDGQRAYARVRAGERVELAPRRVHIEAIEVHTLRPRPAEGTLDVEVEVRCSSGTYVRAIARDLGNALGVGGHLTALRRTAVGPFDLADARTLDQLAEEGREAVLPIGEVARRAFDHELLDARQAADVRVGRRLALRLTVAGPVALFAPDDTFLALYRREGETAVPVAVFV